jgi:hypothetical protein
MKLIDAHSCLISFDMVLFFAAKFVAQYQLYLNFAQKNGLD